MSDRLSSWGLQSPDEVGSSEYRAIYEIVGAALEAQDADAPDESPSQLALAVLGEFISDARSMRDQIKSFDTCGTAETSHPQSINDQPVHTALDMNLVEDSALPTGAGDPRYSWNTVDPVYPQFVIDSRLGPILLKGVSPKCFMVEGDLMWKKRVYFVRTQMVAQDGHLLLSYFVAYEGERRKPAAESELGCVFLQVVTTWAAARDMRLLALRGEVEFAKADWRTAENGLVAVRKALERHVLRCSEAEERYRKAVSEISNYRREGCWGFPEGAD